MQSDQIDHEIYTSMLQRLSLETWSGSVKFFLSLTIRLKAIGH